MMRSTKRGASASLLCHPNTLRCRFICDFNSLTKILPAMCIRWDTTRVERCRRDELPRWEKGNNGGMGYGKKYSDFYVLSGNRCYCTITQSTPFKTDPNFINRLPRSTIQYVIKNLLGLLWVKHWKWLGNTTLNNEHMHILIPRGFFWVRRLKQAIGKVKNTGMTVGIYCECRQPFVLWYFELASTWKLFK